MLIKHKSLQYARCCWPFQPESKCMFRGYFQVSEHVMMPIYAMCQVPSLESVFRAVREKLRT